MKRPRRGLQVPADVAVWTSAPFFFLVRNASPVAYAVTDALQLDLLLNNVTDEEIFSPGSFDGVIREEGRTYLARVKYLF